MSYRNDCGEPRQRVLASLGCAQLPVKELKSMEKALERNLLDQCSLFADEVDPISLSTDAAQWVDRIYRQIVRDDRFRFPQPVSHPSATSDPSSQTTLSDLQSVFIDQIEHTHAASLGPLLVAKAAWEQLDLSRCLRELGFTSKQITAAAASVMSRLVSPSSEYAMVQWIPTTAMPELLGDSVLDFNHQHFYRISDKLLKHQADIESHLRQQSQKLFALERTILLYDLTNTYFEGEAKANPKAKRGKSKEKRHDRPLVVLGIIYDGNGFALAHKTFAGNMNDGNSLVEMAQSFKDSRPVEPAPEQAQLQEEQARPGRTLVVVDAGVATTANLTLLRNAGFSYLVNDSRKQRRRYHPEFADHEAFTRLLGRSNQGKQSPVEVRTLQELTIEEAVDKETTEQESSEREETLDTILLCRSHGREEKESAMFSKAEERFVEAVIKLDERLKKGSLKESKKIQQAIGRLKARHPRVQRFYEIKLSEESEPGTGLTWKRQEEAYEENKDLFGCYALRTDRQDFTSSELWRVYVSLTQAEEGFRALKTDLGLRPNYHHKEDRVDGHIFITVLAFQLWKWIRQKLDESGDRRDWVTVRRLLETHCYSTVIVPSEDGSVYHLRKPGRAEGQQREVYEKLGININKLPKNKLKMKR
jgi:transposase